MSGLLLLIPRVVILIGGAAVGVVSALFRAAEAGPGRGAAPSRAASPPPTEPPAHYAQLQLRLSRLENVVERHEEKLRAVPSAQDVMNGMNEIFDRNAASLDDRFAEQARSIESLTLMVGQTDELLEKVLDSIYSLPSTAREGDQEPQRAELRH